MGQTQTMRRNLKPRQLDFIKNYTSPKSETYSNGVQSAIKAGYSVSYANTHAHRRLVPLVQDRIRQSEERVMKQSMKREAMLVKAEENLASDLDIKDTEDVPLRALRNKTSVFVAETIGKDTYSKRTEVDNKGYSAINEVIAAKIAGVLLETPPNTPLTPEYKVIEALVPPVEGGNDAPSGDEPTQ